MFRKSEKIFYAFNKFRRKNAETIFRVEFLRKISWRPNQPVSPGPGSGLFLRHPEKIESEFFTHQQFWPIFCPILFSPEETFKTSFVAKKLLMSVSRVSAFDLANHDEAADGQLPIKILAPENPTRLNGAWKNRLSSLFNGVLGYSLEDL